MEVWIGTSGYSYPDWVGGFYPAGTGAGGMFAEYVRWFPLVELNFTFYQMPTAAQLGRLVERAPVGFQFIVKVHQSITHGLDLTCAKAFCEAMRPIVDRDELPALLCQFPQRFHCTASNKDYVTRLGDSLTGSPVAVEFRHGSWADPQVFDWLRERGLHLVSVDVPEIAALFPTGLVQTSRMIYVRFHSHRAESWYGSDKERYDYLYSDSELQGWLDELARNRDRADRAFLLFNNCHRAQAAENARRVQELLERMGDDLEVVAPFAAHSGPRQESLF